MSIRRLQPDELGEMLVGSSEYAILDPREMGDYEKGHLFRASVVPLNRLELMLGDLVPRRDTQVVWCGGQSWEAELAAERSAALGWTDVAVLDGGVEAWRAAGGEVYSGVNVPSKAFGELVERQLGTPHIAAPDLQQLIDDEADLVVLDSRPFPEFHRMSIPTATDMPGAELVHRVRDMAPDPATTIVVNCAGRTRSIIGAQSLIDAGVPNRVMALENGTMGWELAGLPLDHGSSRAAPSPGPEARAWAADAAAEVATRHGVQTIDEDQLTTWQADSSRTTMIFDVRSPEEYEAGHRPDSCSAPGGQLVQATDQYMATQNARLVLVDDDGVRATMTASWLRRLGWDDAVVLVAGLTDRLETGPRRAEVVGEHPAALVSAAELAGIVGDTATIVVDLAASTAHRKGHIPGAWWTTRNRLDQLAATTARASRVVLTSTDDQLARVAFADAAQAWDPDRVVVLDGGTDAWVDAGNEVETGQGRQLGPAHDVWAGPMAGRDRAEVEAAMNAYLVWEIALTDQVDADPTVRFNL
ncbi:MAG: hypothetical protein GY745_10730 [Actinomycetia bacterium]|nr:hypothetical protein [Actinomycetes bacterium]